MYFSAINLSITIKFDTHTNKIEHIILKTCQITGND